jgi:mycothiol synthase
MNHFEICRCDPSEYQSALKCLHDGLSPDQQQVLVQTLDLLRVTDDSIFSSLIVAKSAGEIVAASWIQFTPGNAAVVWPPAFDSPVAPALMSAVDAALDEQKTRLAQILMPSTEAVDEDLLARANFHRLVDLAYFTLERANFANYVGPDELQFVPRASEYPERIHHVIRQSYEQSLDCPELNDLRDPAEIVAGYQVQGTFEPENWFLIHHVGRDVGVLVLTEHPPGENWELVYMGIIPSARGQGFGEQVVRFAVEQARIHDAERLVLAVDQRNSPALETYRRVGFVMWDRRTVYARLSKANMH